MSFSQLFRFVLSEQIFGDRVGTSKIEKKAQHISFIFRRQACVKLQTLSRAVFFQALDKGCSNDQSSI